MSDDDDDVPRDTSPTVSATRRTLDLSDWFTLAEAARAIGVSTRTIERFAQAKKLEQRLRPQARGPQVAVYDPTDVARLATERRPAPAPFVLPAGQAPTSGNGHRGSVTDQLVTNAHQLGTTSDDPIRQLFAAALRAVLAPTPPTVSATVSEKSFVTIPEASAITGLTQAYLKRAIEAGTLKAIRDVGWRIRRKDLEAL